MLRPTKHSHPDRTVINLSMLLLGRLKTRRLEDYDTLRRFAKKNVKGAAFLFLPALNFLFLLGLIDYHPKGDSIEYLGSNEAL